MHAWSRFRRLFPAAAASTPTRIGLLWLTLLFALAPARAEPPAPLLWQAGDAAAPVYLLGSFHLLKSDDYPLAEAVESAYTQAERVVFEISPEQALSPALAATLTQRGLLPAEQSLTALVSTETRAGLVRFLGSEAALATVDRFKPWFLTLGIAISAMQQAGFDPNLGLDMHLMRRAQAEGKPTAGLETAEDQFAAFDAAPLAEQEVSLREVLRPLPEIREEIDSLHRFWRAGDSDGLEGLLVDKLVKQTPVSARLFLHDRNQRWLPQLRRMIAEGKPALVVVGAMHLIGEDGLPEQLARQGVPVRRVLAPATP